jgi:23S rRNA pseudouridine1911/1915/1917 synthase
MVVARTAEAHRALSRAFARREVEKSYLAVVYGSPEQERGTIDAPIGRHPRDRKRMTVRADGRPARSDWSVLARAEGLTLLRVDLHTGRTHQIRVHLKSVRLPLVGDPVYGEERWRGLPRDLQRFARDFPRPALHAWRLAFHHPVSGEWQRYTAPLPEDLEELWVRVSGAPPPI